MNSPSNLLLCSTGTVVSRKNGYDDTLIYRVLPSVIAEAGADGLEFMMVTAFYDRRDAIVQSMRERGISFRVFHCDKDIGEHLSRVAEEDDRTAIEAFRFNCEFASALGASMAVLHLWGGFPSDYHFYHNLSFVPRLCDIAAEFGLTLLFENVPCSLSDPLTHWHAIHRTDARACFIYDTRFGELHRQHDRILADPLFTGGAVRHIHISDFIGNEREFRKLRPIYHPGEGQIRFNSLFAIIRAERYCGSVTLESPVVAEDGSTDPAKLIDTLRKLRSEFPAPSLY